MTLYPPHTYARPLRADARGYLARAAGTASLLECVRSILDTAPGEIEMQPTFGSRLPQLLQEPNDAALAREMEHETKDAIGTWEKRLRVDAAEIVRGERSTSATLTLRQRASQARTSETVSLGRGGR